MSRLSYFDNRRFRNPLCVFMPTGDEELDRLFTGPMSMYELKLSVRLGSVPDGMIIKQGEDRYLYIYKCRAYRCKEDGELILTVSGKEKVVI